MATKTYVEKTIGQTHYVYGPFPSVRAAQEASMLNRAPWTGGKDMHPNHYVNKGVCGYEDSELAYYVANPDEAQYKKFISKPAAALRVHNGWREFGMEFSRRYVRDFAESQSKIK